MSASPFQQHLGTNYVPSAAQLQDISAFVKQSDARLAELNAELAVLLEKRDKLKESIDGHKALLSITRRLPTDIMQNIFNWTLPPFAFNTTMDPSDSPLLLTRVCRSWREIAINLPHLWSAIHIPIPAFPTHYSHVPGFNGEDGTLTEEQQEVLDLEVTKWISRMEHRKALVKAWLSRAKGTNLSISLVVGRGEDHATEAYFKEMIDIIRPYSTQWRSLFLRCRHNFSKHILSIPASETPILHTVSLDISAPSIRGSVLPGYEPKTIITFPPDSLVTSPSLRILSVEDFPVKIQSVPAPFANLTKLHFWGRVLGADPPLIPVYFTSASALDILELCPNLQECSLTMGADDFQRSHHLKRSDHRGRTAWCSRTCAPSSSSRMGISHWRCSSTTSTSPP
ncbi:hypothetical protein CC2G_004702 [Coprinopsis cinerea AmutBmut pab1-1]|nr:hypothetical protein CC2G_004702 [Coprinopsis cinerea AmutBmut pab1-1]